MTKWNILIVEDDDTLREAISDTLQIAKYAVTAVESAEQALAYLNEHQCSAKSKIDLVLSDIQMAGMSGCDLLKSIKLQIPDLPVILLTAYATVEQAIEAIRNGASEYLIKPFEANTLLDKIKMHLPNDVASGIETISDPSSKRLFQLASKVAKSSVSVLINGESGVGKEVLARYIHQNSSRKDKPFVAINCAAIPENMLEAVLFGYEKGAFTGAYQRNQGKFELAQYGTLLLDEISEMDIALQAKLLRVLQEKEVERLGGRATIQLDVRVLATTNRDLADEVKKGKFREDLFYRLNVFPLTVLPLRKRINDILPLAEAMIVRHYQQLDETYSAMPTINVAAQQKLLSYHWPGNIRELENVIQRALVVCQGGSIGPQDLVFCEGVDADNMSAITSVVSSTPEKPLLSIDLKKHEQELILQALVKGNGSRKYAAETLGISPRTLRYKISKMREQGIDVPSAYGMA